MSAGNEVYTMPAQWSPGDGGGSEYDIHWMTWVLWLLFYFALD